MNYRQAFLADVLDHPDDDAPRFVFADWLEENGDEDDRARAEFIRVQCELARRPAADPACPELTARADALQDEFAEAWADLAGLKIESVRYRRGFIDWVEVRASHFLDVAPELLARAPVQGVRLEKAGGLVDRLVGLPEMARLRKLEMPFGRLDTDEIVRLTNSPSIANLRALSLRYNPVGDAGVRALARSPHCARLRELDLGHGEIYPDGARALGSSPHLLALTALDLHFNELGPDGARALAASPILARLRTLDLGFNEIGDEGALALSASRLQGLTGLVLSHGELGNKGITALAGRPEIFSHLRTLELQYNNIGDPGARALAAAPFDGLARLNLSKNRVGAAGAKALADGGYLHSLEELDLESNPIGDGGALALAASPWLEKLGRLTLAPRDAGETGKHALREKFGERIRWYG